MFSILIDFLCRNKYWWHSPSEEFDNFDFNMIGSKSLRYGWGIYFSTNKEQALMHNNGVNHIYRFPVSAVKSKSFINYSKDLKKHSDPRVISVAKEFYGEDTFDNESFGKGGHRFYDDIRDSEIINGEDPNGCAARYLVQKGISGAVIDEPGERIVLLYDTELWENVDKVQL